MANEESFWSFELVKGGTFTASLLFEDDDDQPVNLTGKSPRILVKFGTDQTLEWTVSGGQLEILSPPADGRMRLFLTQVAINALTFRTANYFLFFDDTDYLVLQGTIRVK